MWLKRLWYRYRYNVDIMSPSEATRRLDELSRRYFCGISGDDFTRLYQMGALDHCADHVAQIAALIPFTKRGVE